jgi:carbamoylphosphate synthase large subunit
MNQDSEMLHLIHVVARINEITETEAEEWIKGQDEDMLVVYWDRPDFIAQCYPCSIEDPDVMRELYY